MRFFLDNDVDMAVRWALVRAGHTVWTASEAGLTEAEDDDITTYGQRQRAIVVTHDNEFSGRRLRNGIFGKHIWVRCREFDAPEVLIRDLDHPAVSGVLTSQRDVLVELHLNAEPKIHRGTKRRR